MEKQNKVTTHTQKTTDLWFPVMHCLIFRLVYEYLYTNLTYHKQTKWKQPTNKLCKVKAEISIDFKKPKPKLNCDKFVKEE